MNPTQSIYAILLILTAITTTPFTAARASGMDLNTPGDNSAPGSNSNDDANGGDGSSNDGGGNDDGNGGGDGNNAQNEPQQNPPQDPRQNMFARQQPSNPVECFGIMGDGQNDNVFVSDDGTQYGYGEAPACHPQGSIKLPADNPQPCENIVVGQTAKGELIRGSLKPNLSRHNPEVCYPYDFVKQQITYMNPDYATPMQ
jgi:hypothetical protein